jgi:hypothetical protein
MFNSRALIPVTLAVGVLAAGVTIAGASAQTPIWLCNPTTASSTNYTFSGGSGAAPSCPSPNSVGMGLTYVASGIGGRPTGVSNYPVQIASPLATGLTIDTPGSDGADINGPTGIGVHVDGAGSDGLAVTNSHGTGVAIAQHGGTGLAVANSKGTALSVLGTATFSTSGLATLGAHKRSVVVHGVALGSASKVLATLQGAQSGVAIEGVTRHSTSLTITLTKPTTGSLKVAWFVLG